VYRGVQLTELNLQELKDKKMNSEGLKLRGFQSTSLSKDVAFQFMFRYLKKELVPVLFEINSFDTKGYSYFMMDS
jgi:hypothetical protein